MNHKRLFRIYREERLMVRKRGCRKRALGTRTPMPGAVLPNDRWSLDFVSDQSRQRTALPHSRHLRRLHPGVPGSGSRCLAVRPQGSPRARSSDRRARQAQDDRQRQRHRADQQCDPGLDGRRQSRLALHRSGQAGAERLHRKLQWPPARRVPERDFVHVAHASPPGPEEWRRDYNTVRPHSASAG